MSLSPSSPTTGSRRTLASILVAALLALGALIAPMLIPFAAVAAEDGPSYELVNAQTQWRFDESDTDPAGGADNRLVWTTNDFDDSAWKTGPGPFGAKSGSASSVDNFFATYPVGTKLTHRLENGNAIRTYFLRTQVELSAEQVKNIAGLQMDIRYDDAAIVYVNGREVTRFNDDAKEIKENLQYFGSSTGSPQQETRTAFGEGWFSPGVNTIAIALYQDRPASSDIYLAANSIRTLSTAPTQSPNPTDGPSSKSPITDLVLGIGETPTEIRFSWSTESKQDEVVQIAPATGEGTEMPETGVTEIPTIRLADNAEKRHAIAENLTQGSTYVYRVGSAEGGWSTTSRFTVAPKSEEYNFMYFGDIQIGSGRTERDGEGWRIAAEHSKRHFPDAAYWLTAGDNVNRAGSEAEYEQVFSAPQIREYPFAPNIGNHDSGSALFQQHFNIPNMSSELGVTRAGGNYWFLRDGVLHINLNSNNRSTEEHTKFVRETLDKVGNRAQWKIVTLHHSVFSTASHVNDRDIIQRRGELPPMLSEMGVDLVLMGHDHVYTRTPMMQGSDPAEGAKLKGEIGDEFRAKPGEVLYVTANSTSGSKFYRVKEGPWAWDAVTNQENTPNVTNIQVSPERLTITTYRVPAMAEAPTGQIPESAIVDKVSLVRDRTAPVITGAENVTIEQGSEFNPLQGVTAKDETDGDLTEKITVEGSVDTAKVGTSTLTYTVTDAAGNTTTVERTVEVALPKPQVPGRIAGANRYDTAVQVSKETNAVGKPVVLATGERYPDALASAAVAAKLDGTLLLTTPDRLPADVAAEIERLNPNQVVIVGDEGAISRATWQQVKQLVPGAQVMRVAGQDRFDTAAKLAERFFPTAEEVFLVDGSSFSDAVSASAAATYGEVKPVLFTYGHRLPAATERAIANLDANSVHIVGSEASISASVQAQVERREGVTAVRYGGADRYETNTLLMQQFAPAKPERVIVATGNRYPDALVATNLTRRLNAPLVLVSGECRTPGTGDYVTSLGAEVTVIGDDKSVSDTALELPCGVVF